MRESKTMNRKLRRVLGMLLALFALSSILLASCASQGATISNGGGSTPTPNGGGSGNCATGTVHTLATTFQEACVNVAKGSSLQVLPAAPSFHNLITCSCVNGHQVLINHPSATPVHHIHPT